MSVVLLPIPPIIRENPRCFYAFDPTHPEYAYDDEGRECFAIDAGVAKAVKVLWAAGILTTGCCDGHGSGDGVIGLATWQDDRERDRIEDHDAYRPLLHSAERRRIIELEAQLRDLREAEYQRAQAGRKTT